MLRAYVKNPPTDSIQVQHWLKTLVSFLDMKILQGPYVSYVDVPGNRGLTAVVMIETSHIAFHVWDEQDPALLQLDVYTCGSLDVESTLLEIRNYFNVVSEQYLVYDRENGFDLLEQASNNE